MTPAFGEQARVDVKKIDTGPALERVSDGVRWRASRGVALQVYYFVSRAVLVLAFAGVIAEAVRFEVVGGQLLLAVGLVLAVALGYRWFLRGMFLVFFEWPEVVFAVNAVEPHVRCVRGRRQVTVPLADVDHVRVIHRTNEHADVCGTLLAVSTPARSRYLLSATRPPAPSVDEELRALLPARIVVQVVEA